MDGELKRLASVSSGANTVLFTLSGIGLLFEAAGLMYAFRERAPGLAYLIGTGLIASGTLVLVSMALYSAAAEFADEYVAGNGAADIRAVLDIQHGRIPRGVVNRNVLETPLFKARLDDYRKRFGS